MLEGLRIGLFTLFSPEDHRIELLTFNLVQFVIYTSDNCLHFCCIYAFAIYPREHLVYFTFIQGEAKNIY